MLPVTILYTSLTLYSLPPFSDESEVLPFAVPVLLSIPPSTHYAIRSTTLKLVSELSDWISKHPDTLDTVLGFIHSSLQMPPVASDAANAVRKVCEKCKDRMAAHFDGLVQVCVYVYVSVCVCVMMILQSVATEQCNLMR